MGDGGEASVSLPAAPSLRVARSSLPASPARAASRDSPGKPPFAAAEGASGEPALSCTSLVAALLLPLPPFACAFAVG